MNEDEIHVFPVDDLFPHDTENGIECMCNPNRDFENPNVIIHNSFDGRELRELAKDFSEFAGKTEEE